MSECSLCEREMNKAEGCVPYEAKLESGDVIDGPKHTVEGSLSDEKPTERCPDCGANPGARHHAGCDWARTPDGGQLLTSAVGVRKVSDDE